MTGTRGVTAPPPPSGRRLRCDTTRHHHSNIRQTQPPTTTDARWGHFKPSRRGQRKPSHRSVSNTALFPDKTLTATSAGVVPFRLGRMLEDATGIISLKTAGKVQAAAKAKVLALGTNRFQALKGQEPIVRVKLKPRAKRTLKKRKKLKVQANITLRDAAGNETSKTYNFKLKAPKVKTKKQ